MRRLPFILFLITAGFFPIACLQKEGEEPDACARSAREREPDLFSDSVYPVLQRCSGCHGERGLPSVPHLHFQDRDSAYASLVGRPSLEAPGVSPVLLVKPGSPEESYLYQKLMPGPHKAGQRMPLGGILPDVEIRRVEAWIRAGAPAPRAAALGMAAQACEACDSLRSADRGSPCHPCNAPHAPSWCVGAEFFRDSLVPMLAERCGSCHGNSDMAQANLRLDTSFDAEFPRSLRSRYRDIHAGLVRAGTFTENGYYPYFRILPSDTAGSLLFQAVTMTSSRLFELRTDTIPDKRQYKLKFPMPPFKEGQDPSVEDPLVTRVRKWILSGAPGPGNLSALPDSLPTH